MSLATQRAFAIFAMLFSSRICADLSRESVALTPVGEFALGTSAPEGLSGITWLGGDKYALVADSGGIVYFADIGLDLESGAVTSCVFTGKSRMGKVVDGEGIAFSAEAAKLFVSDEFGSRIAYAELSTNVLRNCAWLPTPQDEFAAMLPNKSLESLAYDSETRLLWTANEEPMPVDAALGSVVRLYSAHVDFEGGVTAHWHPPLYYPVDKPSGEQIFASPIRTPFNGLVELCAIGDGLFLAMERSCGLVSPTGNSKAALIVLAVYLVDTQCASPNGLSKKLLWTESFPASNYEGMAVGPRLADASRALILVSDGDRQRVRGITLQWHRALYSLKLQMQK